MRIIRQGWEWEVVPNGLAIVDMIERAARTCYRTDFQGSDKFIKGLIKSGHHSTLEHGNLSVRIVTDRGVTHELVRHRIAAYSQESTRYCNYSQDKFGREITCILPVWMYDEDVYGEHNYPRDYWLWHEAMQQAETAYFALLDAGWKPQQARDVLPNSLKTEIVMTANIREWRHFFTLRAAPAAHPQMRELAQSMLKGFRAMVPILFNDIMEGE